MAFSPKNWQDRLVEFAGRRRLTDTGEQNVVDVTREEGTITQTGDAFSAANMNELETRIQTGFNDIFPVGSIFFSVNDLNPTEYFAGTTWESFGTGRVIVGVDAGDSDFDASEKTGGNKNLQTHSHAISIDDSSSTTHNHSGRTNILSEGIGTNRDNNYGSSTQE